MIKGTTSKKANKRGAPILSAFEAQTAIPAAVAPVVRSVEVKFDSMSLLELGAYVAKQASAIEQLKQELIRDPALIKLFSIPVIKEMGRIHPEFVRFLYHTDAIKHQLCQEHFSEVADFCQLADGNPAFAEELFKDKVFRDNLDENQLARLCEASEKNASEVVKDMQDYLNLKQKTADKSKLPTLPSAFKLIRDGMRPLTRAVYAHEALAHEILTSDLFKGYVEGFGCDTYEKISSKHASVASHVINQWLSYAKMSSAITHRVAMALASTSLENFIKVYQFTEKMRQRNHSFYPIFSFEEYDIAIIAEKNEAVANYVWSNNELMRKLSGESKVRIARHFPALAEPMLSDRQFCQRATGAEIYLLGSVRREIAQRIYDKPELVARLDKDSKVDFASKYDFFADLLFADQQIVAEMNNDKLHFYYLSNNDGKALCSNARRILANYGVANRLTVHDAKPLSNIEKVETLLRRLAVTFGPAAEDVAEEKPAKQPRKSPACKR